LVLIDNERAKYGLTCLYFFQSWIWI